MQFFVGTWWILFIHAVLCRYMVSVSGWSNIEEILVKDIYGYANRPEQFLQIVYNPKRLGKYSGVRRLTWRQAMSTLFINE